MSNINYQITHDDNKEIEQCQNCGYPAPTYLFPPDTHRNETRLCKICANTHLDRQLKSSIQVSNDDIAKGLAWCINLLVSEIAQLRAEIAEMKNKKP